MHIHIENPFSLGAILLLMLPHLSQSKYMVLAGPDPGPTQGATNINNKIKLFYVYSPLTRGLGSTLS